MQILLIGGAGQIGFESAKELCSCGHSVMAVTLPQRPKHVNLPKSITLIEDDYNALSEERLFQLFSGCEGFVFVAGANEDFEGSPPIDEQLMRRNVIPLRRMLPIARRCGVKQIVVVGSSLSYYKRIWKEMTLEDHPYVRVCVEQADVALSFADEHMNVSVLELPLVVGGGQWSRPLLLPLVAAALENPKRTLVSKGGTALITVHQAAQAVTGALEHGWGGRCYPVGFYNLTWVELMQKIHQQIQLPEKKVRLASAMTLQSKMRQEQSRLEGAQKAAALNPVKILPFRMAEAYLERQMAVEKLGVGEDDLDAALEQTVKRCVALINGTAT